MTRHHDALFKLVFSDTRHAAGLLRSLLPRGLAAAADWDRLELVPGSFIDEALADCHTDLLFAVPIAGVRTYIYVLVEHRSTPERFMALRLLGYIHGIAADEHKNNPGEPLTPVIPVVICHAPGGWRGPRSFAELLRLAPGTSPELLPHIPDFTFVLDDLAHVSDDELRQRAMAAFPRVALWALCNARSESGLTDTLDAWIQEFEELARSTTGIDAFGVILRYILLAAGDQQAGEFCGKLKNALPEAEDRMLTYTEARIKEGWDRALLKGREEGREQGRRAALAHLIAQRFGALTPGQSARLEAAGSEVLDRALDRILTADSVDALLAD